MTELQEIIYNIIPPNILEKGNIEAILDIFFKVVDDTCKISADIPEYVNINTDVLSEDIMKIYLENIWSVLTNVKDAVIESEIGSVDPQQRINYCYSGEDFNLPMPDSNYFNDNESVGLQNISNNEEFIVINYLNNGIIEKNKKFIMVDNSSISTLTTIQEAVQSSAAVIEETCCSNIPCAQSSIPLVPCTLDTNINSFISNYNGTDLAGDILSVLNVTDCKSQNPQSEIATEPKYNIGDNWLFTDFYVQGDYAKNNFKLGSLLDVKNKIDEEYIWSSKDFKQNKGHAVAFYFAYNIIKGVKINENDSLSSLEYIDLEEKRDNYGDLVPFNYVVKSLIKKEVYEKVIYPIAHPVGFNGTYKRLLGFNFTDNFCEDVIDDYDVFYIYCINDGSFFDLREEFDITVPGATGNELRYNVEIDSRTVFEQHGKTIITINMSNGYTYIKDFDGVISLVDNSGVTVKKYNSSCGLVPIKTKIKRNSDNTLLETIDNDRTDLNTKDFTTGIESYKVYRIDFSDDGIEEGGFLSSQHTKIYLVDELGNSSIFYHLANDLLQTYNANYTVKQNYGEQYRILFNGLEYKEIQLCLDKQMDWIIYMEMRDNNCIPHHLIVQEEIPTPSGYTAQLASNLDISLDQTRSNFNMNTFINNYIANTGSSNGIAEYILAEGPDFLLPLGVVDVLSDSLQGIDENNNNIIDWEEYNVQVPDWGWTVGDDIIVGKYVSCGDEFIIKDSNLFFLSIEEWLSLFNITDNDIYFGINQYFNDIMSIQEEKNWIIKEKFDPEYYYITIPGGSNNTLPNPQAENVDMNAFISSYIASNGSDDDISREILNSLTAPGAVTNSNGTQTVQTAAKLILDASDDGGFYVGGSDNISSLQPAEFLGGTVTEESPPGTYTDTDWNSF